MTTRKILFTSDHDIYFAFGEVKTNDNDFDRLDPLARAAFADRHAVGMTITYDDGSSLTFKAVDA